MRVFQEGIVQRIEQISRGFSGILALYARDLRDGDELTVLADRVCETASVIKVPILVALWEAIESGRLAWDERVNVHEENRTSGSGVIADLPEGVSMRISDLATLMIIVSDNVATNELIDRVGMAAVNASMARRGLPETTLHKKLYWDLPGPLGTTTPREMARLLVDIRAGRCVSTDADRTMLDILAKQHYTGATVRRFPYRLVSDDLEKGEPAVRVASKSGSLVGVRNDVAIVSTRNGDYVLAMFTAAGRDARYHPDNEAMRLLPRLSRGILEAFCEGGAT